MLTRVFSWRLVLVAISAAGCKRAAPPPPPMPMPTPVGNAGARDLPPERSQLEERVAQLREVASRGSTDVRLRSLRAACVTHRGEIVVTCGGETTSGQVIYGATWMTSWAIVSAEFERAGPEVLGLTWMGGAVTRQVLSVDPFVSGDGPRCSFRSVVMRATDFGAAPFAVSYEAAATAGTPGVWRLFRNGVERRVSDDCP